MTQERALAFSKARPTLNGCGYESENVSAHDRDDRVCENGSDHVRGRANCSESGHGQHANASDCGWRLSVNDCGRHVS